MYGSTKPEIGAVAASRRKIFSEGAAAGAGAPCEAAVCQRELESGDRNINPDDHIRVRGKNYHTGCEPPDENE
jgi:hypothetical protein